MTIESTNDLPAFIIICHLSSFIIICLPQVQNSQSYLASRWPRRVLIVGWAAKETWNNPIDAVINSPSQVPIQYHNLAQSLRLDVPQDKPLCKVLCVVVSSVLDTDSNSKGSKKNNMSSLY